MSASPESFSIERKMRMYEARLRILDRINPEINRIIDLDKFLQATVTELGKMMEVDRCDVLILSPTGEPRISHAYRASEDVPSSVGLEIPIDLAKLGPQWDLTKPIVIEDTSTPTLGPVFRALAQVIKTRSLLVVPIMMKSQIVGSFGFHQCHSLRKWHEEEIAFVQSIAKHIATGYEYTKIYTEKEKEAEITKALLEIATDINTRADFGEMAAFVIDRAVDLLKADFGCLAVLDPTEKQLHFDTYRTTGSIDPSILRTEPLRLSENRMLRDYFNSGRTLRLEHAHESEVAQYYLREVFKGESALLVPIPIKEKVFGLLNFVWTKPHGRLTDHEVRLAEGIASQIAVALERDKLTAEVVRLNRVLQGQKASGEIIGASDKIKRCINAALLVADSSSTVLLQGESGTGKELLANLIQLNGSRRDKIYVKINCGAIPETLIESELFGHERGAFTDARGRRIGKFEEADGGTLFLDEVGELSLGAQVKLLRVLQDGEFTRVGGNEVIKADLRVIAATNINLEEAVEKGKFRRDLFYRLNVYPVVVPPLRERKEDIPLLALSFLERFKKQTGRHLTGISEKAMQQLKNYDWPGNVRELENVMERSAIVATGRSITVADLPENIRGAEQEPGDMRSLQVEIGQKLETIERAVILETLAFTRGDKTKASVILGVGRKTLYRKLLQYRRQTPNDDPRPSLPEEKN